MHSKIKLSRNNEKIIKKCFSVDQILHMLPTISTAKFTKVLVPLWYVRPSIFNQRPIAGTAINLFINNHFQNCAYSIIHFSHPAIPMWTDAGEGHRVALESPQQFHSTGNTTPIYSGNVIKAYTAGQTPFPNSRRILKFPIFGVCYEMYTHVT